MMLDNECEKNIKVIITHILQELYGKRILQDETLKDKFRLISVALEIHLGSRHLSRFLPRQTVFL